MAGYKLPIEYSEPLDQTVLMPLSHQLCLDCGLPPFDELPWHKDERELAMMLHSVVIFLGIRRNIYNVRPLHNSILANFIRFFTMKSMVNSQIFARMRVMQRSQLRSFGTFRRT
jgi:hypothetical protein